MINHSPSENLIHKSDRAVVLLSSGLDSSVNLYRAHKDMQVVLALTFDYGQRAAQREIIASRKLCELLNIRHQVIELPFFKTFTSSALTNRQKKLPRANEVKINNLEISQKTAQAVWVPNRNGIFLNIAAGFAEHEGAKYIIPGFNLEEAQTFPDNSVEYMRSLDFSFSFSTANQIQTHCFTAGLYKSEIAEKARELAVPLDQLWPCYEAGEQICGECESCQRFLRAVERPTHQ